MPEPPTSSLASLLLNLNTSSISSISATINGSARLVDRGSEEETFYRERHLENNTFDSDGGVGGGRIEAAAAEGQGTAPNCFVAGEEVRVIVVDIKHVRISDWKGGVRDWTLVPETTGTVAGVNGIR